MRAGAWSVAADGTLGQALDECLRAAAAAPSIHNTQPWRFRPHGRRIDILIDRSRQLEVLDPHGRELLMSAGAAILNLRIAMLAHGRQPLLRLPPSIGAEDLVASVIAGPPVQPTDTARTLARAIARRHTSRQPFADVAIEPKLLAELSAAARAEGGRLAMADETTTRALLSVIHTADRRRAAEPRYRVELADWTSTGRDRRDGVPPQAFGPRSAFDAMPIRDFGLPYPDRIRKPATFETRPNLAVLYTTGDSPPMWLRAGQALERVLLTATVRGLATGLFTQPIEDPELRELLGDPHGGQVPQAILRLGYGRPSAPTPRRPVRDLVVPG
jgi:nitroreductase